MKKIFCSFMLLCLSQYSSAALIKSAWIDSQEENLLIKVQFPGGCGHHRFILRTGACRETYPLQCSARLYEYSNDTCEALVQKTLRFPLSSLGLDRPEFDNAMLTIYGDRPRGSRDYSKATVRIP
jgi:hypothetical protein